MSGQKSDFPEELSTVVRNFHTSVASLEGGLKELEAVPRAEVMEGLEPLDKAKLELVSAYAVNSLFWMLLKTMGEDPKEGVKPELDRIRQAMNRCKEIKERAKRGKVDKKAAKRMVASGLWKPGQAKIREGEDGQQQPRKKIKQFEV